jgi:hypothetical protein
MIVFGIKRKMINEWGKDEEQIHYKTGSSARVGSLRFKDGFAYHREGSRNTTSTRDRETEQEDHDLGSTIHAGRDEIVPFDELLRTILPEVPLANKANEEVNPDRGVDTDYEVAHEPKDD